MASKNITINKIKLNSRKVTKNTLALDVINFYINYVDPTKPKEYLTLQYDRTEQKLIKSDNSLDLSNNIFDNNELLYAIEHGEFEYEPKPITEESDEGDTTTLYTKADVKVIRENILRIIEEHNITQVFLTKIWNNPSSYLYDGKLYTSENIRGITNKELKKRILKAGFNFYIITPDVIEKTNTLQNFSTLLKTQFRSRLSQKNLKDISQNDQVIRKATKFKATKNKAAENRDKIIFAEEYELDETKYVHLFVHLLMEIKFSSSFTYRRQSKEYYGLPTEDAIELFAIDTSNKYLGDSGGQITKITISLQTINKQEIELLDNLLRKYTYKTLLEFDNIHMINVKENCVRDYLKQLYPKIGSKTIDKLGDISGVQIKQIMNFCNEYNISHIIYDQTGNIISQKKRGSKSHKHLSVICYDNHIYPLTTKKIKRIQEPQLLKRTTDTIKIINKCLSENKVPFKMTYGLDEKLKPTITSFYTDKSRYINNLAYERCVNICKKLSIDYSDLSYNCTILSMNNYIRSKLMIPRLDSFFPINIKKSAFRYKTKNEIDYSRQMKCIDKSKCYPYCMTKLKYLLQTDWRIYDIINNPTEVIEYYLYIVKPDESSILLPSTNIYSGEHVNYCKNNGLNFEILYGLPCTKHHNYYIEFYNKLYKLLDNDDFKEIMVIDIGKGEKIEFIRTKTEYKGILNDTEAKMYDGVRLPINDEYSAFFETSEVMGNIYNEKPIAIQMKDYSRRMLFEKINDMKLKDDDIIYINTDSICYYGDLPKGLNSKTFDGWKEEEIPDFENIDEIDDDDLITFEYPEHECIGYENTIRHLSDDYAGRGKTYYIINKLIPLIRKRKESFLVLAPTHAALKEYRNDGIKCEVIQKYTFIRQIPKEKNIIIDEYGLLDETSHNLLWCIATQTVSNIYAFGDTRQLEPYDKFTPKSKQYIDILFEHKCSYLEKNQRNNFTDEYYQSLIDGKLNILEEVKKYSKKNPMNAELIISFRSDKGKTRDIYNEWYLEQKKLDRYDIGVKYVCTTNLLRDLEIYNKFDYVIEKSDDKNIVLTDGENSYTITKGQLNKNFSLGYCKNIHQVQGSTLKSYYWTPEDDYFLTEKYEGYRRVGYTIISRLKGNVYK